MQLPLDLGHLPALGRADFLIAPCNEAAAAWLDRWPDWPASALALFGPAGSGKSHLAQLWRLRASAVAIDAQDLASEQVADLLRTARAAVVDEAECAEEEALLHLYNLVAERGGHLLIISRQPPARWGINLADLRSRLLASPAVAVAAPDDALIGAVLIKLFADRQLAVSEEVIAYLVVHLERSFAAAQHAVAALDAAALARGRAVTVKLARQVLAEENT